MILKSLAVAAALVILFIRDFFDDASIKGMPNTNGLKNMPFGRRWR